MASIRKQKVLHYETHCLFERVFIKQKNRKSYFQVTIARPKLFRILKKGYNVASRQI